MLLCAIDLLGLPLMSIVIIIYRIVIKGHKIVPNR